MRATTIAGLLSTLWCLSLLFLVVCLCSGCSPRVKSLPAPRVTMHGYLTTDGYIYVIEPKSGESIAIKAIHTEETIK